MVAYARNDQLFNIMALVLAATFCCSLVLVPVAWGFYAMWGAAFSETYYVMACLGDHLETSCSSKDPRAAGQPMARAILSEIAAKIGELGAGEALSC